MKENFPSIKKFTLTYSRPQSVLRDENVYAFLDKYINIPSLRMFTVPLEGDNRAIYVDSIFLKKLFEFLLKSIATPRGFRLHLERYEKLVKNFERVGKEIMKVGSSKRELLAALKKANKTINGVSDYAWMPIPVENILVPRFIESLKKKYPDQWEEIDHAVSSPVKLYEYQRMRLKICDAVINNKVNSKDVINGLVKKYRWLGEYSYIEPLHEADYFRSELLTLTKEAAVAEKNRINNEIRHNKKKLALALKKIKDKKIFLQATILNEYAFLRTARVEIFKKMQTAIRNILKKTAEHLVKESGKPWSRIEVAKLLNSEIEDFLAGKSIPEFDLIIKREKHIYYRTRNMVKITNNPVAIQKIKDELDTGNDMVIKGRVAHKGCVKGIVAMVFSKSDLPKVTKESILVARTTMPDYTPAMEIAKAFVTEEGGVTSHAAIIARELKKPCIVGTGNCTKILKDGDLIEVDADKGIVRILKKVK